MLREFFLGKICHTTKEFTLAFNKERRIIKKIISIWTYRERTLTAAEETDRENRIRSRATRRTVAGRLTPDKPKRHR